MKRSAELVFIPIPGIATSSDGTDAYIESVAESSISQQRIKFINLPQKNMDTTGQQQAPTSSSSIDSQQTNVKDVVTKLIESESETRIVGFVIDMFCTSMIDVANEFGVPTYVFFASGAAVLGLMFHLQELRDDHNKHCMEFKDSTVELATPSYANPLPVARVLLSVLFEKDAGDSFLDFAKRFRDAKGILVNTFTELESYALHSLDSDGKIPPVFPVGPILNIKNDDSDNQVDSKHKSDILKWLDDDYADHTGVLPEGFLDRTARIGKEGWSCCVSAQKIERGIKEVMDLDSGIRKKVKEISENSKKALLEGGSSYSSLGHFIDQI
ncbi:hypothetical protein M0R45_032606 [Rubus argutus]|uniref:Uncharacterized protein n=1 Tax=Rubus argutus TaxID=59490 RepID=A0AAW1WLM5_RUBAR